MIVTKIRFSHHSIGNWTSFKLMYILYFNNKFKILKTLFKVALLFCVSIVLFISCHFFFTDVRAVGGGGWGGWPLLIVHYLKKTITSRPWVHTTLVNTTTLVSHNTFSATPHWVDTLVPTLLLLRKVTSLLVDCSDVKTILHTCGVINDKSGAEGLTLWKIANWMSINCPKIKIVKFWVFFWN